METFEKRLKRWVTSDGVEIFGWMSVLFQNDYAREIKLAAEKQLGLSLYLITHAVMQTVSEAMFDLKGLDSTRFFLSHYVDGADADKKFSAIADEIHVARNVLAHQGYSSLQHQVEYFSFEIKEGWKKDNTGTVHINPSVYAQLFLEAITNHKYVSEYEKESTEVRAVRKYRFIRKWLSVDKNNPISQEILKLDGLTGQDFQKQEAVVQRTILNSYKVT